MNIRDLDLNLLYVFEAIYSCGNISQAAKQLDLSQPAVSNALSRLRKQLDDQLFVRKGNGVVPTPRAEALISPVRSALATIRNSFVDHGSFDPGTSQKHFRLVVADPLEPLLMPALLNDGEDEPNITYELFPPQSVHIEDALNSDHLDLAVFLVPARLPELHSEPLVELDLVVLASKKHPRIRSEGFVGPDVFARERLVALNLDFGKLANSEKLIFWQRMQHKIACKVFKVSSIPQIVAETDLIGIVPRAYAEHVAKLYDLQILSLKNPIGNQRFHLIWHERNDSDDSNRWIRDKIRSIFAR